MSDDRNKSCEERINAHKESRFNALENMNNLIDMDKKERDIVINEFGYDPEDYQSEDEIQDLQSEIISEYPLEISEYKLIEILLSTGGPGDFIRLKIDNETNNIISGEYIFNDWWDYASRVLSDKELYLIESLYRYTWEY